MFVFDNFSRRRRKKFITNNLKNKLTMVTVELIENDQDEDFYKQLEKDINENDVLVETNHKNWNWWIFRISLCFLIVLIFIILLFFFLR